jgi:hypothetical protein
LQHLKISKSRVQHSHIGTFYTWSSPYGKTHGQIDHILTERRRHSSVLDVQSLRSGDCGTDHYLVGTKVKERLAANKQRSHSFQTVVEVEVEGKERYGAEISDRFAALKDFVTKV